MKFSISLLMFIIGIIFISSGYVQDINPECNKKSEIRIVPRNVYDQLIKDSTL